jgi:hypothetical protein
MTAALIMRVMADVIEGREDGAFYTVRLDERQSRRIVK